MEYKSDDNFENNESANGSTNVWEKYAEEVKNIPFMGAHKVKNEDLPAEEFSSDKVEDSELEQKKENFASLVREKGSSLLSDDDIRRELYTELDNIPVEDRLDLIVGTSVDSYAAFMTVVPKESMEHCAPEIWSETATSPDWSPERLALHEEIVDATVSGAEALSQRLRKAEIERGEPKPIVYVMRGCCGAGKTTALRNGVRIPGVLDENGKPSGTLAPDVYKGPLRRGKIEVVEGEAPVFSHSQVHQESGFVGQKVNQRISEISKQKQGSGEGFSIVYDKLMGSFNQVEGVARSAESTERNMSLIDVDVPLELSAIRVLGRTAEGDDPQMNFDSAANAFYENRTNRRDIIERLAKDSENGIHRYELVVFDTESHGQKTLMITEDGMTAESGTDEEISKYCPSEEDCNEEIEATRNQVISPDYIERFLGDYFANDEVSQRYAQSTRALMEEFMGMTIADAMAVRCGQKKRSEVNIVNFGASELVGEGF